MEGPYPEYFINFHIPCLVVIQSPPFHYWYHSSEDHQNLLQMHPFLKGAERYFVPIAPHHLLVEDCQPFQRQIFRDKFEHF